MVNTGDRLRYMRNDLQLTVNEVITNIGIKQGYYSKLENSLLKPSRNILEKISTVYNVSSDWILYGTGSMLIEKQIAGNAALMGDVMGKANVTVSSIAVNGGGGVPSQIVEVQNLAFIPFVRGGSVAFPLQGKSMCPVFESGDWLICSTVNRHEDIKATNIYVVKLTDGTLYCKYIDKKGAVWLLRSEDWRNYPNIEVSTNDIEKVYQIDQRITSVFGWNN